MRMVMCTQRTIGFGLDKDPNCAKMWADCSFYPNLMHTWPSNLIFLIIYKIAETQVWSMEKRIISMLHVLVAPLNQPWSILLAVFSLPLSRATLETLFNGGLRMPKDTDPVLWLIFFGFISSYIVFRWNIL
jgi:hypothetical protein